MQLKSDLREDAVKWMKSGAENLERASRLLTNMTLIDLKDFLDDVVASFAAVLDLEMTIVNKTPLSRVSGTSRYQHVHPNWNQSYTVQVLKHGKPLVALDTSDYRFSDPRNETAYHSLILYPIHLDQAVEGVIVLASFTEQQQQILASKQHELVDYLEKTASLVSAKLQQERLLNQVQANHHQLRAVLESVSEGLLLYSGTRGLLQINERAKEILCLNGDKKRETKVFQHIEEISEKAASSKEILQSELRLSCGGVHIAAMLQARPIGLQGDAVLFVIRSFDDIQQTITQNLGAENPVEIVTRDPLMRSVCEKAKLVAKSDSNVLILGESGTGKELLARSIHLNGPRRDHPFVAVNCAAIPETLLESELFGYEEGSFTGAKKGGKIGKFLLANTGTIFLDEIGDMPLYLQAKLLRVLSDRQVDRIGAQESVPVDVRIIAATNKPLEEMIESKEFRADLYYRLSVIELKIPPLRRRPCDIELLIPYFIDKYNVKLGKGIKGLAPEVWNAVKKYPWVGNVRELENAVEYMVNFEEGEWIRMRSLPQKLTTSIGESENFSEWKRPSAALHPHSPFSGSLKDQVAQFELHVIAAQIRKYGSLSLNLSQVREICQALGISQATFYRRYEKLKDQLFSQI